MQNVNIQTAQNVGIDYELAGLGARMGAFLVDTLVQIFFIILISLLLDLLNLDSIWLTMSFFIPVLFYHFISEVALNGQSIGKKQFNIKVVNLDGSPPTLGGYFLRWILRPIDIGLFSGGIAVIAVAMSNNAQRLGDMAAGTTVVRVAREITVSSHELINKLQSDYSVTFPEVRNLTDAEVSVIKEALQANKTHANIKPVLAMNDKVKSHLSIQSDLPPVKFLYTVIKDYKYITSQA